MTKLVNPVPLFDDGRGGLLDAGYVYVGQPNTDPEIEGNRIALYWDVERTVPASQPLRTLGGVIVQGGNLGLIYFAETSFSITKRDANGNLITYIADAFDLGATAYQPLDTDLSAIAGLSTTAFGRGFLTLVDAAALRTLAGLGSSALLDETTAAQFRSNAVGKVLTADKVWGAATSVALTPGASVAVDLSLGFNFTLAMGGNYTLANPTNVKDGQSGKIEITQDATGTRTLSYGPNWDFANSTPPVLSTAANAKDILFYEVLSDGNVFGSLIKARG